MVEGEAHADSVVSHGLLAPSLHRIIFVTPNKYVNSEQGVQSTVYPNDTNPHHCRH